MSKAGSVILEIGISLTILLQEDLALSATKTLEIGRLTKLGVWRI